MIMLTLDDVVRVVRKLVVDEVTSKETIRQELEQKCWFPPEADEAAKHLNDLIFHINPAEICGQIELDTLREWCSIVQTEMKMAMMEMRMEIERRFICRLSSSSPWASSTSPM